MIYIAVYIISPILLATLIRKETEGAHEQWARHSINFAFDIGKLLRAEYVKEIQNLLIRYI